MSSVVAISTTAVPSPVSTTFNPSQAHAREGVWVVSLTALSLRHGHARRRSPCDQPAAVVDHVGLAEEQRLLPLDDPADRTQAALADRAHEVDRMLDRG